MTSVVVRLASIMVLFAVVPLLQAQTKTTEYVSEADNPKALLQREQHARRGTIPINSSCCQWTTPVIIDTSSPNLQAQTYAAMAVDDSGNIAVAWMETRNGGGNQIVIQRSTNQGQTWFRSIPYNYAYLRVVRDIAFDHAGDLWLLWTSSSGEFQPYFLNLSKSTDNGQTFTTMFTAQEYAGPFFESKLAIDRHNNVFILWPDQQFKLTRFVNGSIAQRIDTEIPNDTLQIDFWCSLALGNQAEVYCVWAGSTTPGGWLKVFCSTSRDTGASFASSVGVDTSRLGQRYPATAVNTAGIVFAAYMRSPEIVARQSIAVARSLDSGVSFESAISVVDSGHNDLPVTCIDATNGLNLLWTGDGGAYFSRSTDTGQTFSQPQLIVAGRPDIVADHMGNLFAAFETSLRIQFARTNVLVSVIEPLPVATKATLDQNYPNPFNPSTTISFSIPVRSDIRLSIFDILGREVYQLLTNRFDPGRYQVSWTPMNLSSGMYFCQLQVTSQTGEKSVLTRKLIYIR